MGCDPSFVDASIGRSFFVTLSNHENVFFCVCVRCTGSMRDNIILGSENPESYEIDLLLPGLVHYRKSNPSGEDFEIMIITCENRWGRNYYGPSVKFTTYRPGTTIGGHSDR